jgi:thymidylate synthase (FAD)
MKIIKASYEILTPIDGDQILKFIELCGRKCYKSEDAITAESARSFVAARLKTGHESIIEHQSVSVYLICDRGISHEIVRHRLASYSQESTRYCNYSKDKFENEVTFIKPCFWAETSKEYATWLSVCSSAEQAYLTLIKNGAKPQEARSVLPNSLKTEIVCTYNLRSWRHFFNLRAAGKEGTPHPQMLELAVPMLKEFKKIIPIIFDDIEPR